MSAPDKEMLAEQQKGQMLGEVAEESVGYLSPTLREGVGYGERPMTPDPRDPGSQGLHYRSGMTWGYDIIKALDADDPTMLTAALQGQDVKPDAVVDRDGYVVGETGEANAYANACAKTAINVTCHGSPPLRPPAHHPPPHSGTAAMPGRPGRTAWRATQCFTSPCVGRGMRP